MGEVDDDIGRSRLKLIRSGMASAETIVGCSEEEIASLERQYRVRLPDAYRCFLKTMGHKAGSFFQGTDWQYGYLQTLHASAETLLKSANGSFQLPDNAFVFAMHQGYSFLYFLTDNDDPHVVLYVEDEQPRHVATHFSEWLRDTVKDEIKLMHEIADMNSRNK